MEESSGLLERTVPFSVIELHFSYGNNPVIFFRLSVSLAPIGGSDKKTIAPLQGSAKPANGTL
jgi:hypothetical protein